MLPHIKGRVLDVGCGVGKLCEYISPELYVGIDIDEESLAIARNTYNAYEFKNVSEFAANIALFDTIVGMAVVEHVKDPVAFLSSLKKNLKPAGRIVLTTPYAAFGWTHTLGSKIGFFSNAANEEHEVLFTEKTICETAHMAGLRVDVYAKFLFGANQLIILKLQ